MKSKILLLSSAVFVAVTNANAALTAPSLDTTDALTVGGAVVAGLAGIWGIRKAISLLR